MPPALETTRRFVGKDVVYSAGSESRQSSFKAGVRCEWDELSSKWVACFPPHGSMGIICRKMDCFLTVYPLCTVDVATGPGVPDLSVVHEGASAPGGISVGEFCFILVAFVCWAATCVAIGMVGTQNSRLLYGMCKHHVPPNYTQEPKQREK